MAIGARPFYLVITVFLFTQAISTLWPKHYLRDASLGTFPADSYVSSSFVSPWLSKRSLDLQEEEKCEKVWSHPDRCAFVKDHCGTFPAGLINYLHFYFCDLSRVPMLAVALLGLWMMFLFGFVGVAASDFFCPNLSTIAKKLNLSESMTGVTFLAFGNGSPDVFSTFSAMGAGSGSLAIGELVGAASFITSVVVGSMAIIKPFRVSRAPFLRDVIFFAGCVAFTLYTVVDGKITFAESLALVLYYIFYVTSVVFGNWWHQRAKTERTLEAQARNLFVDDDDEDDFDDGLLDDSDDRPLIGGGLNRGNRPPKITTFVAAGPYDPYEDEEHDDGYNSTERLSIIDNYDSSQTLVNNSYSSQEVNIPRPALSPSSGGVEDSINMQPSGPSAPAFKRRPSLLSAMEFNDVVRSLTLSGSRGLIPSYDPSYYGPISPVLRSPSSHRRHNSARTHASASGANSPRSESPLLRPFQAQDPNLLMPGRHSEDYAITTSPTSLEPDSSLMDSHFQQHILQQSLILPDHHDSANQHLGHIHSEQADAPRTHHPLTFRQRLKKVWGVIKPIYFPTLLDWDEKSRFVKFLAVTSIPMVLLLTLTLPVVELCDDGDAHSTDGRSVADSRHVPEIHIIGDTPEEEHKYDGWSRTATTVQMLLAPVFIAAVISSAAEEGYISIPIAFVVGAVLSFLVHRFSTEEHPPRFYGALCFVGFVVAITWIFLVANEVVGILQALGMIFRVSDAILGLTIFAMGNSLGDLVANITIAKMGFPRMAFSACFGGPLLNMLLGVGISGTYMTVKTGKPIPLQISPTLFVSLTGVLFTLMMSIIIVPRNGYMMNKNWGLFLLGMYMVCTTINIVIEIVVENSDVKANSVWFW